MKTANVSTLDELDVNTDYIFEKTTTGSFQIYRRRWWFVRSYITTVSEDRLVDLVLDLIRRCPPTP